MGYARSLYWERAFQYLGIVVSIVGKNRFQGLETTIIRHSVRQPRGRTSNDPLYFTVSLPAKVQLSNPLSKL